MKIFFGKMPPLDGERPVRVLDISAPRNEVVLQTISHLNNAAVWSTISNKIVWRPQNAIALCWLRKDTEIIAITYSKKNVLDGQGDTWKQSNISYNLELFSWPSRERIAQCDITIPTGWPDSLRISPEYDCGVVVWFEQDSFGFEVFKVGEFSLEQVGSRGWSIDTNLVNGPVFSVDGSYVALSVTRNAWWNDTGKGDEPSPGGLFVVGNIVLYNLTTAQTREFVITDQVAKGWLPGDENDIDLELISDPKFNSYDEIVVDLPTGSSRMIKLR